MSNGRKHPTTNDLVNTTLIENSNYKQRAEKLKREHDKWEAKQIFEVIRPDNKTIIYRRIPNIIQTALLNKRGKKLINQSEIHKGRI